MSSAFTKHIVLTAEPRDRPYELRDAQVRGLILRVRPSGHNAWIVTWAHGKRRTLGSVEHLTLDQARDQARQAVAEYVQSGLPALARSKPTSCTLEALLNDYFEPWAVAELKGGRQYTDRIRSVFPWLLRRQIIEIDVPTMERWWRGRVTGPDAVTRATAARDFACLRSALSRAVEWKLIETNPLMGMRQRSAASRKVVWFLSPDEEAMLRAALAVRDLGGAEGRANANAARRKYRHAVLPDLPMDGYVDNLTPVVLTAINTGMRRGELLSMSWADINWEAKMLTIRAENAKSGRQRHIPLNVEAMEVLQRWARQVDRPGRGDGCGSSWGRTMRVFVDFNNLDPEGCLRLNLVGTLQDLEAQHLVLEAGMLLTGSDGDLNARIIVLHPGKEGVWRGQIVEGPFEDAFLPE